MGRNALSRNEVSPGIIESRQSAPASSWRHKAFLAIAGCLWGTGFLFGKIAFREMTVVENVSFRFLFGCTVLLPIALHQRQILRERRWSDLWLIAVASIIAFPVQFLVQFKGLELTTVSHASLIVGTLPVMVALASVLFLRERLRPLEWVFLLLSPVGVLLIALSSASSAAKTGPTLSGDLLVILSLMAATVSVMMTKRLMERYNSLEITAWMAIIGTAVLLSWSGGSHSLHFHFSREVWVAVAAQGFLATAGAYLFWNAGLARIPASRAGVFINLEPLVGTCLGVVVLHDRLGPLAVLGGALIVGTAVLFSRKPHP